MDRHVDTHKSSSAHIGAMLFLKCCSGARMHVHPEEPVVANVCGLEITNWGCHSSTFGHSYLNVACAIGMQEEEIPIFCKRFDSVLTEFEKSHRVPAPLAGEAKPEARAVAAKQEEKPR